MTATAGALLAARFVRLRQAAAEAAAMLRNLPAYLPTVSDRVLAIECSVCQTWVRPGRFVPARNACSDCLTKAAAAARERVVRGGGR